MPLQIQPGKFITKCGKYVEIHSQKTMGQGRVRFWHGFVLSHFSAKGGTQGAWNEDGSDMGGNYNLDLLFAAVVDATENVT